MDHRSSPPPSPTIVVVEDDSALLNALTFALETEGFLPQAFRTGAAMAAWPELAAAACLIIDQNLPDEPGLDLLARLRAGGVRAPAVVITTNPPPALRAQATRLNVPVIEKPLLGDQLFACVRRLIGGSRAVRCGGPGS